MISLSSLRRGLVLVCALTLAGSVLAEVPHRSAKPAYPEEQTILQTERNSPEQGFDSSASGKVHMDRHYLGEYGATEGTVILQRGGNTWRLLRNGPVAMAAGFLLLATPLVLLGAYLGMARPVRIETGSRLERFNRWQRWVHWSTAFSFIAMALTGVIILFGKNVLLPWMGHDVFYWVAIISKWLHNFVGPLFIVCSILMFITFVRENAFRHWDWYWIKHLGGLFSRREFRSGYFNAGEKIWFWGAIVLLGLFMSATGLVLDFVNFGQTRYILQIADYLHLGGATLYIAGAMGHIYVGTVGSPNAYEAMRDGPVDAGWAKLHHGIWYDEVTHTTTPPPPGPHRRRHE